MKDLRHTDLSARLDEDLTPAERLELKRRFKAFVTAIKEQSLSRAAPATAPKRVRRWQPPALDRRVR